MTWGRARYSCEIGFTDAHNDTHWVEGRARVAQRGRRYKVDYRIYW